MDDARVRSPSPESPNGDHNELASNEPAQSPTNDQLPHNHDDISLTSQLNRAGASRTPSANTSRRRRRTLYQDGEPVSPSPSPVGRQDDHEATIESKEHGVIDWYAEGPGRRVGYDDFTAIDWIYEYAKERQRLRMLYSSASGVLGCLRQFIDASQIWLVLVGTGLMTGAIAALIDIASDWLGDLKTGVCVAGEGGGRFYLNHGFCCWGLDEISQCADWHTWGQALHIGSNSGSWIMGYVVYICLSILFAVGATVLVKRFAPEAKQSGIPELKTVLGGFVMRRFLGPWVLLTKSVGLCLSVASGLWLGKEGPLVHVACCCSSLFLKFFPVLNGNEARKREILSAAAAAGISVAFGAPLGGVLFTLEQLSYYFPDKTMWQSFVCAMVAAVTLQAFNPFRTGKLVLYQVTYSTGWHAFELFPFAILGVFGGLYGAAFIKLNMRVATWRKHSKLSSGPILEVVAVAIVTALINYPNGFMRVQFPELVATLFSECSDLSDEQLGLCGKAPTPTVVANLLAAAVLGFFLAAVTFGLRLPAGIMLPSVAIGALYGRALGLLFRRWQYNHPNVLIFSSCEPDVPCITAGQYAVVGAASAFAGATRMTASIVVIMFELTGALTYVLPIMISVLIAKWVGDAFGLRGIYESWIGFNGYPYLDNRDDNIGSSGVGADAPVSGLMTRIEDLVVLSATGHTISSLSHFLAQYPFRGFPVVASKSSNLLLGYISRTELSYALTSSRARGLSEATEAFFSHQPYVDPNSTLDLRPWMDQTPITLSSKANFQLAYSLFLKLGLRYVIFADNGKLKGVLSKKDAWRLMSESVGDDMDIGMDRRGVEASRTAEEGEAESSGLLSHDVQDERDAVRIE